VSDTIFGPKVTLKRHRHDGSVDTLELPALMMGTVLLHPNGEYTRAKIERIEDDDYGVVQSMTEWVRSV